MAVYEKHIWESGDQGTKELLNHIENGVYNLSMIASRLQTGYKASWGEVTIYPDSPFDVESGMYNVEVTFDVNFTSVPYVIAVIDGYVIYDGQTNPSGENYLKNVYGVASNAKVNGYYTSGYIRAWKTERALTASGRIVHYIAIGKAESAEVPPPYVPYVWTDNDRVTSERLEHIESGLSDIQTILNSAVCNLQVAQIPIRFNGTYATAATRHYRTVEFLNPTFTEPPFVFPLVQSTDLDTSTDVGVRGITATSAAIYFKSSTDYSATGVDVLIIAIGKTEEPTIYIPQTWSEDDSDADGELNIDRLNHIESGITTIDETIRTAATSVRAVSDIYEWKNGFATADTQHFHTIHFKNAKFADAPVVIPTVRGLQNLVNTQINFAAKYFTPTEATLYMKTNTDYSDVGLDSSWIALGGINDIENIGTSGGGGTIIDEDDVETEEDPIISDDDSDIDGTSERDEVSET